MNNIIVILLMINFAYIGLLPRIFFKKDGRYNLMWWITGGPLFINALTILLQQLGWLRLDVLWTLPLGGEIAVVALSAFSIGMISYTMGTHRIPLSLWHQNNDAPANIVTWGAYKYVRHPFYSSFIAAQLASILLLPHPITLVGMIWCLIILNRTAAREEKNLSASSFGAEYQSYIKTTGRFFPKLGV
ncbi:MAG: methyltransferase family protein [Pseudobdellovibrionaceae bacterium]